MKKLSSSDVWGIYGAGYMIALSTWMYRPELPIPLQFLCLALFVLGILIPIMIWRWADVPADDSEK